MKLKIENQRKMPPKGNSFLFFMPKGGNCTYLKDVQLKIFFFKKMVICFILIQSDCEPIKILRRLMANFHKDVQELLNYTVYLTRLPFIIDIDICS